jgi:ubiquinone/menaquinone biosynthesis C-methylase UbiE
VIASDAEKLGKTGERMVPQLHQGSLIYAEHMIRYLAGQELVKNKIVLDVACGSGYGTKLLADNAKKAFGVDVDKPTIEYAKKHYASNNTEFLVGDGEHIPLPDHSVDVVITYETIEHIRDYEQFMRDISRVLKPDGLAVISTPNDLEFAEGNHYHLHEFTEEELEGLVRKHFKFIDSYYQATWKFVAIGAEQDLNQEELTSMPLLSYSPVKPEQYLYFFLLCSNRKIKEKVSPLGALGEHYSDRYYIGREMQHEQNIEDFKKVRKELTQQNNELNSRITELQQQLDEVVNSKRYKTANKIADIKGRFNRRR